jgi:hypothetical protein
MIDITGWTAPATISNARETDCNDQPRAGYQYVSAPPVTLSVHRLMFLGDAPDPNCDFGRFQ